MSINTSTMRTFTSSSDTLPMSSERLVSVLKETEAGKKIYETAERQVKALGYTLQVKIISQREMNMVNPSESNGFGACFDSETGIIYIVKDPSSKSMLHALVFELLNASAVSKITEIYDNAEQGKFYSSRSFALKLLEVERNNAILCNNAFAQIMEGTTWKQFKGDDPEPFKLGKDIHEFSEICSDHMKRYRDQFEEISKQVIEKHLKEALEKRELNDFKQSERTSLTPTLPTLKPKEDETSSTQVRMKWITFDPSKI